MKSSGGSRRDPADVAPGANHGDDDGGGARDDAQLRAMRAVWLEMRDEEPPGGGLAALLATARIKAEAMQPRPSRWQRLVAALRRPPVLALATVMVLLAGAAILGRRAIGPLSRADEGAAHHALEVGAGSVAQAQAPRAAAGPSPGRTTGETDAAVARAAVLQSEDAIRENKAEAVRAEAAASEAAMLRTAQANEATLRAAQAKEAAGAGTSAPAVRFTRPPPEAAHHDVLRARPPAMEPAAPVVAARPDPDGAAAGGSARSDAARAGDMIDGDDEEPATRAREAAPSSKNGAGSSAASPVRRLGPGSTELARLHQQCESAARRGDCPVVRQLVERITRADRGYRARVAKDSAVAKCLAE